MPGDFFLVLSHTSKTNLGNPVHQFHIVIVVLCRVVHGVVYLFKCALGSAVREAAAVVGKEGLGGITTSKCLKYYHTDQ
jgi:hypothetical protein